MKRTDIFAALSLLLPLLVLGGWVLSMERYNPPYEMQDAIKDDLSTIDNDPGRLSVPEEETQQSGDYNPGSYVGKRFFVVIDGYDPRDMLQGRYIIFRYVWDDPRSQKPPVLGLPETGRFYVPESDAPDLETMFREDGTTFGVNVILMPRTTRIENMLVNGQPWQEALKAWRDKQPAKSE